MEWIKASEIWPDTNRRVLVHIDIGRGKKLTTIMLATRTMGDDGEEIRRFIFEDHTNTIHTNITHWMDLPKDPKKD